MRRRDFGLADVPEQWREVAQPRIRGIRCEWRKVQSGDIFDTAVELVGELGLRMSRVQIGPTLDN